MSKVVLRLITKEDLSRSSLVLLKDWRVKNSAAYLPARNKITLSSTRDWLKELLADQNRFLFWVMAEGVKIGHMGFKNIRPLSIEIDNVVRGEASYPGSIHIALEMILDMFPEKKRYLHVLQSNRVAIDFYERNGFEIVDWEDRQYFGMEYNEELTHYKKI